MSVSLFLYFVNTAVLFCTRSCFRQLPKSLCWCAVVKTLDLAGPLREPPQLALTLMCSCPRQSGDMSHGSTDMIDPVLTFKHIILVIMQLSDCMGASEAYHGSKSKLLLL